MQQNLRHRTFTLTSKVKGEDDHQTFGVPGGRKIPKSYLLKR